MRNSLRGFDSDSVFPRQAAWVRVRSCDGIAMLEILFDNPGVGGGAEREEVVQRSCVKFASWAATPFWTRAQRPRMRKGRERSSERK